jgi:hypothetical protein
MRAIAPYRTMTNLCSKIWKNEIFNAISAMFNRPSRELACSAFLEEVFSLLKLRTYLRNILCSHLTSANNTFTSPPAPYAD